MSFTRQVKEEIININITKAERIACLSAFFRTNAKIDENSITLLTESKKIAGWIVNSISDLYNSTAIVKSVKSSVFNKKDIYMILINEKINLILVDLSVTNDECNLLDVPAEYIISDLEEKKAYIRGVFLSKGSINDPKTAQYHLEFLFDNKFESVLVQRLLNDFNLDSKLLLRDKKYMVYIKDSEKISDFLKVIGASKAVMYYEDIRVFKEQKNITNRLNNCEQANTDKIVEASLNQIGQIKYIDEVVGIDVLDDKLKEACIYRNKYPDASLLELSNIISIETNNNITKSGLNHRFRKIKEIYEDLKSKGNK